MAGKLPLNLLEKYVFTRVGVLDPCVLVGPAYGEDAAVVDLGNQVLVVHSNPITGAVKWLGWLAVHVACNDVAVTGARPRWLLPVLFLPEHDAEKVLDEVTRQIDEASKELGVMIVGGHSEVTPGLDRPLVSMTALGLAAKGRYVRTGGAKPGDYVIMTKTAGLEGTAILATDFAEELLERGVSRSVLDRASQFIRMISVVKEALILAEVGASSMHDPTEGGVLGGLAEIAYASKVRIVVEESKIPVAEETRALCTALRLDPLKLISSGVLLATVPPDKVEEAASRLEEEGVRFAVIGRVEEGEGVVVVRKDGTKEAIEASVEDELFRAWRIYKG